MFGTQSKQQLGFVRAKHLGILAVFNLNKSDSCDILACLEHVDPEYSGKINVLQFGELFCQENRVVFNYLWETYQAAIGNTPESLTFFSVGYTEFLNFLLFFVSIGNKEIIKYIYYIWFFLPRILPLHFESDKVNKARYRITLGTLEELLTKLMGTLNPKKAVQLAYYKKKLKKAIKDDSVEHITFNQFKAYNLVIASGFSKPIQKLQAELRATMIGKNLWNRVHHGFSSFMRHPQKSLQPLDDTDYLFYTEPTPKKKSHHHHHHEHGKDEHGHHHHHHHDDPPPVRHSRTVYRSLGERRDARLELQPLLAFLKNYIELPLEGFKKKKRFHRKKHNDDESEDAPPPDDHEFDDEEDSDDETLDGKHTKKGLFSRLFGPKQVKVAPIEETNPIIAKCSAKMSVKPNMSTVSSPSSSSNSTGLPEVTYNEPDTEQDLDCLVESIIAKGANEVAQYGEVMSEDIDVLLGRAHHAAHKAEKMLNEATVELDLTQQVKMSSTKSWGMSSRSTK